MMSDRNIVLFLNPYIKPHSGSYLHHDGHTGRWLPVFIQMLAEMNDGTRNYFEVCMLYNTPQRHKLT
jgi:hypothetical protein